MAAFGSNEKIVLTDEQIIMIEALAATLSVDQCADYFGIAKQTFYDIMERQPEAGRRYKHGKAKAINNIAGNLIKAAMEGDGPRQMFYLKTQGGWKETAVQEHAGSVEIKEIRNVIVDPVASIIDK